jgi:hypothetical protein
LEGLITPDFVTASCPDRNRLAQNACDLEIQADLSLLKVTRGRFHWLDLSLLELVSGLLERVNAALRWSNRTCQSATPFQSRPTGDISDFEH